MIAVHTACQFTFIQLNIRLGALSREIYIGEKNIEAHFNASFPIRLQRQ